MPLVSDDRLYTVFDLPVALPQMQLDAGNTIAVATIQLPANSKLDLRWLQLVAVNATFTGSTNTFALNSAYPAGGILTLFLIQNWNPISNPWTQSVITSISIPVPTSGVNLPQIAAFNSAQPLQITASGTYTFVILNNTANANLDSSVTGSATLDIDPLASS